MCRYIQKKSVDFFHTSRIPPCVESHFGAKKSVDIGPKDPPNPENPNFFKSVDFFPHFLFFFEGFPKCSNIERREDVLKL